MQRFHFNTWIAAIIFSWKPATIFTHREEEHFQVLEHVQLITIKTPKTWNHGKIPRSCQFSDYN